MAVWLVRAGMHGEYEQKFLQEKRIYVTWPKLSVNLDVLPDRDGLYQVMSRTYPGSSHAKLMSNVNQVWPFAHDMKKGDLVLMPLQSKPAITIGEVAGPYRFEHAAQDPFYHWRSVSWIAEAVPRSYFGRDLLVAFASSRTICRVHRNNAEERLAAMKAADWKPEALSAAVCPIDSASDETSESINLEALARDQIARLIAARFPGRGLARLVDAVLKARGYTTCLCADDAHGDAYILAGAGPLGFAAPRLCVAVRTDDAPVDRPAVDRLLEAAAKFGAQEELLISWPGFSSPLEKELKAIFFQLRLWSQKELLDELLAVYEGLDAEVKAELPLKRIWTAVAHEE
ncbi:MAG: restriction endonuclease [Deltaproteobacteria bacterium]|nr:restriction endonuclease [Deltaproteobacteria bacterium]